LAVYSFWKRQRWDPHEDSTLQSCRQDIQIFGLKNRQIGWKSPRSTKIRQPDDLLPKGDSGSEHCCC